MQLQIEIPPPPLNRLTRADLRLVERRHGAAQLERPLPIVDARQAFSQELVVGTTVGLESLVLLQRRTLAAVFKVPRVVSQKGSWQWLFVTCRDRAVYWNCEAQRCQALLLFIIYYAS